MISAVLHSSEHMVNVRLSGFCIELVACVHLDGEHSQHSEQNTVGWASLQCSWLCMQALSSNKPYPSGVGGSGIALASDGSVALLSGSPATATTPANAFLFSFYTSANQYNACPQQISVRPVLLSCTGFDPAQVDKHSHL